MAKRPQIPRVEDPDRFVRVDTYVEADSLGAQLRKSADIAAMGDDSQLSDEVEISRRALEEGSERLNFVLSNAGYQMAEGLLRSELESHYVADSLAPEQLRYRALTLERGVLGVSADATLAVATNSDGTPKTNKEGKVLTLNGYVDQAVLAEGQSALYAETTVPANLELLAKIQREQSDLVTKAFEPGKPLVFEARNRRDLTELL